MENIEKELIKARKEIEINESSKEAESKNGKNEKSRKREIENRKNLKVTRETRIPFSVSSGLMQPKIPGYYVYGFVAESEHSDEIIRAKQAGYEFIYDFNNDQGINKPVNSGKIACKPAGGGLYLYWMKIPIQFKEDDWERERKERLALLEQINEGVNMAKGDISADKELSASQKQLLGSYKGSVSIEKKISQLNHPR